MMITVRNPEEIFAHHGWALGVEDLEEIVADYANDAVLIVQDQIYRGKDGARAVFAQLLRDIPQAVWEVDPVFADDILFLSWKARGARCGVEDGIDTFVFKDGLIRAQTVRFTLRDA